MVRCGQILDVMKVEATECVEGLDVRCKEKIGRGG